MPKKMLPDDEYYRSLPKKRVAVGVIFLNQAQQILIVKPCYKDHWSIPGGVVEENQSLLEACKTEVKEEVNLDLHQCRLLCVDYKPADNPVTESLQIIFFGGSLLPEDTNNICHNDSEIETHKFVELEEAVTLVSQALGARLPKCFEAIKNKTAFYLDNGEYIKI